MSFGDSFAKLPWWGRAGIVVVLVVVAGLPVYDMSCNDCDGGHEPFAWLGDDAVIVRVVRCPSAAVEEETLLVATLDEIEGWIQPYRSDCWPSVSGTVVVDAKRCEGWALPGEIRIHSCREAAPDGRIACKSSVGRVVHDELGMAHHVGGRSSHGTTRSQILGSMVLAADVYLEPRFSRKARAGEHEIGHALGITVDRKDPANKGRSSHTTAAGHLMSSKGDGTSRRWMNRCDGGDWPF